MPNYKPQVFAKMLGVSVKTLQRWDRECKLNACRTPSNRRYYTHKQYVDYMSKNKNTKIICPNCGYMIEGDNNC